MRLVRLASVVLFTFTIIFFPSQAISGLLRTAKVTLVVVEESNQPIEGTNAGIVFETNRGLGRVGMNLHPINGLTDSEGKFSAQHKNDSNYVHFGVEKKGYYFSSGEYRFKDRQLGRWQPWNHELKIMMRKIGNPVPMYAQKIDGEIPVVGKKVGFDLEIGDWVSPYGKGVVSDLSFFLGKNLNDKKHLNSELSISFREKFDGIIHLSEELENGSEFKLPRFAPLEGYQGTFTLAVTKEHGKGFSETFKRDDNYIFRVRSREDENGEFEKGMYGKILGPIKFAPFRSKTAAIEFKYYLNPDFTRNLEFDPNRNFFGNLPPLEQVGIK